MYKRCLVMRPLKIILRLFLFFLSIISVNFSINGQTITTVAGGGAGTGTDGIGDGLLATNASIGYFGGLTVDTNWNIYIVDGNRQRIRMVDVATGIITTIAGTGVAGYNGDGIPATLAQINGSSFIINDDSGNLYFYDYGNNRIRKINAITGIISTYAGNGTFGNAGDNIHADSAEIDAGDMAFDTHGNLYYGSAYKIRKIDTAGIISTYVGTGLPGITADSVLVSSTSLAPMNALAIDGWGNIYFSDSTRAIRKINVSTGIITRVAGTGDNISSPYSGDGIPARTCHIGPYGGIQVDDTGNIYICDNANSRIEKVDTFGIIHTIAGTGISGFSGDNASAINAEINSPENVVLDKCNNVYIADFGNRRVRKVTYHSSCFPEKVNNIMPQVISIYPNPTYNSLNIDNIKTLTTYRLLNLVGLVMKQGILKEGANSMSVRSLPSGMYMLELINNEGTKTVKKITKE